MTGVTVTNPWRTSAVVDLLAALPGKLTVRIVFDEFVPAQEYGNIPARIHAVAEVMGEILDSAYVKQYTVDQYAARVREYLAAFREDVDIWEIGNEVNGEWLGTQGSVVQKIDRAYSIIREANKRTAITFYYNKDCWERADHEMFAWIERNISSEIKDNLDYALVSYYEDDCGGAQSNWQDVFNRLAVIFPNTKLGIGECGTTRKQRKADYIRRYYMMNVEHPRFIGGHFWWYFNQDMVPKGTTLWRLLEQILLSQGQR